MGLQWISGIACEESFGLTKNGKVGEAYRADSGGEGDDTSTRDARQIAQPSEPSLAPLI